MKKLAMISAAVIAAMSAAVPMSVSAADDMVYGTMNIPYTDFYAAEMGDSAGEVDAVTSATKKKVLMNGEGQMFEGTFNNGEDSILGVTYPVAISQADLDTLGDNNYGFTKLDAAPEAFKNVTVKDGKAAFSAVQDAEPETAKLGVKLSTETPWGDYLIDLTDQPEGFDTKYSGVLLKTSDDKTYAFRHLENIWRGEIAWSSGIKKEEPHGNQLKFEKYTELMGSTVKEIVLITKKGYVTVETETYIPIKFASELTADNSEAGTGSTKFTASGFPQDYKKKYEVAEGFKAEDGKISYTNAKPGSYKLTISDESGKYAPLSTSFVLETDALPVQFKDGKLVKADDAAAEDAENFIKNLSKVEVGENAYNASGKGAVKIFDENNTINFDAESRNGKVFADGANGTYTLKISATGYRNALTVQLAPKAAETTAAATTTKASTTTAAKSSSSSSSSSTTAAKTGDAGVGLLAALTAAAGAAVVLSSKKRKN